MAIYQGCYSRAIRDSSTWINLQHRPMSDKFRNSYRIASARLQHWNYGWAGSYFITICTKNRENYFGNVVSGKMRLSPVGVIADICWHEIKNHTRNIELGEFVVMPNHMHGILVLSGNDGDGNDDVASIVETLPGGIGVVETLHATSLRSPNPQPPNPKFAHISPKPGTVSTIIRSYKSAVTKHAHRLGFDFGWQSRFHDHIIRNEASFHNISNYILNNPQNWPDDKFYSK